MNAFRQDEELGVMRLKKRSSSSSSIVSSVVYIGGEYH